MVIVDSSYLICLLDGQSRLHKRANFELKNIALANEVIVVSSLVATELLNIHISKYKMVSNIPEFLRDIRENKLDNFIYKNVAEDYFDKIEIGFKLDEYDINYIDLSLISLVKEYNFGRLLTFNSELLRLARDTDTDVFKT